VHRQARVDRHVAHRVHRQQLRHVAQFINYGRRDPRVVGGNEPTGSFRLMCEFSHLAYDDPIVYPGDARHASHLHMFFGNTGANADVDVLLAADERRARRARAARSTGRPTGRRRCSTAAGKVVAPEFITVYYKGPGRDVNGNLTERPARCRPGCKMIAGYDMASPQSWNNFEWNCELTQRKQTTIPSCPTGEKVGVLLAFPTCWDGKNLDSTNHRSHMSYGVRNPDTGRMGCPTTHPVSLPEFTLGIWFTNDGNSQNWVPVVGPDGRHGARQRLDVPLRLVRCVGSRRPEHVDRRVHQRPAQLQRRQPR
jgi:hypothetical protein